MSPHLSPHLGPVAHLEPTTHTIPHFLAHTPGHPPFFSLGAPICLVIQVWTNKLSLSLHVENASLAQKYPVE